MGISFQSVEQNGVNVMSLKESASKTEPSALLYKLLTALNGLSGLNGVLVTSTHLETVYRQGREHLSVVKR